MKPKLEFRFSDPKEWWAGQKLALGGEICVSIHTRLCAVASIPATYCVTLNNCDAYKQWVLRSTPTNAGPKVLCSR